MSTVRVRPMRTAPPPLCLPRFHFLPLEVEKYLDARPCLHQSLSQIRVMVLVINDRAIDVEMV